ELSWTAGRRGNADGICMWFDAVLFGEIGFSNAPGRRNSIYGSLFFPFAAPIALHQGDRVSCRLAAQLVSGDYVWQWRSSATPANSDSPMCEFFQSTFFSMPWSLDGLRSNAPDIQFPPPRSALADVTSRPGAQG